MEETKSDLPHHPHNNLFEEVFREKEVVIDLIKRAFPPELFDLLDLDKLKQDTSTYVSSELAKTFSDTVWRTKQKSGNQKVAIALLFEHKSYQPKDIYVQLLHYMTAIWMRDAAANRPLTIIIPIVFYHGKTKWKVKLFAESFKNLSPIYKKFIPAFEYILFEVSQISDEVIIEMSNEHLLGALMLQYKKAHDAAFVRKNDKYFFAYFKKYPEKHLLLRMFITYMLSRSEMREEELINIFNKNLSSENTSDTMTAYQSILNKGKAEGKAEGELKEREKAIKRLLLHGILPVPDIADLFEVPVAFVIDMRDALLRDGNMLVALVRDFKI